MSLMAANEESDPSAILNGFWVTLLYSFSAAVYISTRNLKQRVAS